MEVVRWRLPVRAMRQWRVMEEELSHSFQQRSQATGEACVVGEGDDDSTVRPGDASRFAHECLWMDEVVERSLAEHAIEGAVLEWE